MISRIHAMLAAPLAAMLACGSSPEQPAHGRATKVGSEPVRVDAPATRPDTASSERKPEPSAPPEPPELAAIPGADAAGPVYFVINTLGVARLDETGAALILGKPERNVQDLFVGPDGAVYLVDARSLRRLDGDAVVSVVEVGLDDMAPLDQVAVAPDGSVWATGRRGLGHFAAGRWTIRAREELGLGVGNELAVGFDDAVWIAGATKLLRKPGGQQDWTAVDVSGLGRALLLLHMTASPTGSVIATNGKQLIRLAGAAAETTPLPGSESIGYTADLAIAPDGTIALASGGCELVRLGPDGRGEPWRLGRDAYACATLEAMAIDARSRIWVASREGLSVIDDSGRAVEYPAGSLSALAGRVSHIAVVGRGPELPEAPAVATASLTGTILVEGEPLAKAKLEACPTVQLRSDGSPCAAAERRFATTTDARGRFRLDDVAIGDYSFAVEIDGTWRWTSPPSFAAQLRAGEVYELGTLALAKI